MTRANVPGAPIFATAADALSGPLRDRLPPLETGHARHHFLCNTTATDGLACA